MASSDDSLWPYLPYPALLKVFSFLDYKDLLSVSEVCVRWYQVSRDEYLWKWLFYRTFAVDSSVPLPVGKSWLEEFKRLCYHIPVIQTEVGNNHTNQVLHISFSHNGDYFATCSKDGYVLLWNSDYPASIKHSKDMKTFAWKYTQFSQFNESDTLLLVSGVHFGSPHSTSGEIVVFNLEAGFVLQCRVANKPYDIFGTWYSDQYLLSGDLHWLGHLVSASYLRLSKASQETDSEHTPITQNMFRFYNRNASSIRSIIVSNCLSDPQQDDNEQNKTENVVEKKPSRGVTEHGNPVSHRNMNAANIPGASGSRKTQVVSEQNVAKDGSGSNFINRICYNAEYRKAEMQVDAAEEDDKESIECVSDSDDDYEDIVEIDKYLIFITGYKTYSPHQIGFKRIKPFNFPKRIDPGPSLKERLLLHERQRELLRSNAPPAEPDWADYESVANKFDKIDHVIDLHGHIVGMALSPDHRYLYVNSRSWPQGYVITNPLDPPPIAQEIDIHVIDLVTLKPVGKMLRAHKAYTQDNDCFFMFLDVSDKYVASGAEDKHGYLWDRHCGAFLAKYPHTDVVNSVVFNPRDPEMLVSVSDDHTIKIWRSRAKVKQLGLDEASFPKAIEIRKQPKKRR